MVEAKISRENVGIPELRQGKIRSWSEMSNLIDKVFSPTGPCDVKFARAYFRAQILISEGKRVKASRLFKALDSKNGFKEFEEGNPFLLKIIDIAVKGKSNLDDF